MTKKKVAIMGICGIIALCFAGLIVLFFSPRIQGHRVDRLLTEVYKDIMAGKRNDNDKINLGSITQFSWDVVYQFGGYTDTETIDKVLGFESHISPTFNETFQHIVFVKNNKIVCRLTTGNAPYYFDMPYNIGITRDNANFILVNSPGLLRLSFVN